MRTWTVIDKAEWGDGPWTTEFDKAQWVDAATGLDCLIVRNAVGALCGYVGVTEGHPLFGVDYSMCPQGCERWSCDHSPESILDVHGGITFSGYCQEGARDGHGICHIPEPGRPERVFWFGWDTAHAGDLCPSYNDLGRKIGHRFSFQDGHYWTAADVQAECAKLARQLRAMQE